MTNSEFSTNQPVEVNHDGRLSASYNIITPQGLPPNIPLPTQEVHFYNLKGDRTGFVSFLPNDMGVVLRIFHDGERPETHMVDPSSIKAELYHDMAIVLAEKQGVTVKGLQRGMMLLIYSPGEFDGATPESLNGSATPESSASPSPVARSAGSTPAKRLRAFLQAGAKKLRIGRKKDQNGPGNDMQ